MWSCGVILFILITGVLPFNGKSKEEITKNILGANPNYSCIFFKIIYSA